MARLGAMVAACRRPLGAVASWPFRRIGLLFFPWEIRETVTVVVPAKPDRMHRPAVVEFDVELACLDAPAARVAGAGRGLIRLFLAGVHKEESSAVRRRTVNA